MMLFGALGVLCTYASANLDLSKLTIGTPDVEDIEYPDDDPHSEAEVELGKMLFFDTRLSKNDNQSCATCHNPELGFSDGLKLGIGTDGNRLGRNAPHIYNLAWASSFFWDGRASTLEEQALGPIVASAEMGMSQELTIERLGGIKGYVTRFEGVYEDGLTFDNVGRAIAAFERTFISDNSAFDQYIAGDETAMSPSAVRGMEIFVGKGNCTRCHDGANFTDDSFHNIGTGNDDPGRYGVVKDDSLKGAFKTPGLRNIIYSAPYMHDGSVASLEDVVELYNAGGHEGSKDVSPLIEPLNLSHQEKADLVAFMGALTDTVVIDRPELPE
jgi:cytochrome c peroxidase